MKGEYKRRGGVCVGLELCWAFINGRVMFRQKFPASPCHHRVDPSTSLPPDLQDPSSCRSREETELFVYGVVLERIDIICMDSNPVSGANSIS